MPVHTDGTTYSIGEAADVLGVSIPTLRLYEHQGLIIPLRRESGHRRYASDELERVRRIREAVHARRFTLDSLRDMFARFSHSNPHDCNSSDADQLPCWMHPAHTLLERSNRCRACEVYTSVIEELDKA
jgi:MerR family transcriptional regulator/heat shock protein HspR